MKRASLVLTFATLAAVDLLVATARVPHRLRAHDAPGLVPIELARPLPASAVERGAPVSGSRPRGTRTSVTERSHRPALDARYMAPLDPSTIGGWVFQARGEEWIPVAGATVQLLSGRVYGDRAALDRSLSVGRLTTQDDGAFEFPSLAVGSYTLRVDWGRCTTRTYPCDVRAGSQAGSRDGLKIVFGTSRVSGTIYDADGLPLAGIGFVFRARNSDGWFPDAGGSSDEFGGFEVTGLPADRIGLTVGSGEEDRLAWPHQILDFVLEEGEERQIDAGSAAPLLHWTGTLRRADGTAIQVAGLRLDLEREIEGTGKQTIEARVSASGEFDAWVPPGTWTPRTYGPGSFRTLAPHALSGELVSEDIVVPGIRVVGKAFERGTRAILTRDGQYGTVNLRAPGEGNPTLLHYATLDAEGKFALDLVEPGEWELSFGPNWIGRQEAPLRITIAAGETERQVDLELLKP